MAAGNGALAWEYLRRGRPGPSPPAVEDAPFPLSGGSRPEAAPGHRESGPAGAAVDRKTRPLAVAGEGIRVSVRFR